MSPHTYSHPGGRFAGILSAVGIHLADIVQEAQEPCAASLGEGGGGAAQADLEARLGRLEAQVLGDLKGQVCVCGGGVCDGGDLEGQVCTGV